MLQRRPDSPAVRWGRRAVTIPAYGIAFAAVLALFPALLAFAAAGDIIRGRGRPRGWIFARCLALLLLYLAAEVAGVIVAFALWLAGGPWPWVSHDTYLRWNFTLQCQWATALFRGGLAIFGASAHIYDDECAARGPILLFVRHVSPVDNLIPAVFVSRRHGLRLRWAINSWLRRDPCIDIVGHRLPNAFVRPGTGESARQVEDVRRLATGLAGNEGVLLYPEGTLYSPAKRERVLARLRATGDEVGYRRAAGLRSVLPPRLGGTLAALEAAPEADVVFCAHVGLEGASGYQALVQGGMLHARVRVRFWRVARADIPPDPEARIAWLYEQWGRIDRFLAGEPEVPRTLAAG